MDIDFQAQRREIDMEMKRRDELELLQQKQQWQQVEARRISESQSQLSSKDDLRFMLEKNRGTSPCPVPQPMSVQSAPSESVRMVADTTEKIPGFDYSRLGDDPSSGSRNETPPLAMFRSKGSRDASTSSKSENIRDELVKDFTKDCDTVALVTQMLIDEDSSLEGPLVKAMRGVLQKVMQKHLDVAPN